ncbi:hypothetical protein E4H04_12710 [Candidatus Bathyarchaeota archaeon]|nr:MAG: hypothetical protein E4H04_12710 [Candidatus Bathyarchaeota archaeon]
MSKKPSEKKPVDKKPQLDKATVSKILRTIPKSDGLELYKAPGDSTGKTATSLSDLYEKIKLVDIRAVNHHFKKREFEKWIRNNLGDEELARRFSRIDREAHGEKLRAQMMTLVKTRLDELKTLA